MLICSLCSIFKASTLMMLIVMVVDDYDADTDAAADADADAAAADDDDIDDDDDDDDDDDAHTLTELRMRFAARWQRRLAVAVRTHVDLLAADYDALWAYSRQRLPSK